MLARAHFACSQALAQGEGRFSVTVPTLGGPEQAAREQGAQLGQKEEGGGEAQHTRGQNAGLEMRV